MCDRSQGSVEQRMSLEVGAGEITAQKDNKILAGRRNESKEKLVTG